MADAKNYSGGCHCGQMRYDVTTDLASVVTMQLLDLPEARRAVDLRAAGAVSRCGRAPTSCATTSSASAPSTTTSVRNAAWDRSRAARRRTAAR